METIETLEQGLAFFETLGMPARNLAARTRQEYHNDLTNLNTFLAQRGITTLAQVGLQDLAVIGVRALVSAPGLGIFI